jgi:glucosyl-3-phosphoglycerate synthase
LTRLLVTPLIRALEKIVGYHPLLVFFDSFRYPLAGEFSMDVDMARVNRIPGDWGLEIGVMAEVYRNTALRRVCQADISDNYEHKHQPLTLEDPNQGLLKMGTDIAKCIFRNLASRGYTLTHEFFISLKSCYLRIAQDFITRYEHDSAINGLKYDRHREVGQAEAFLLCIESASQQFLKTPVEVPYIANWNRVASAVPAIFTMLLEAGEADSRL